jgi:DNA-binding NarL/FixJ family response regulator
VLLAEDHALVRSGIRALLEDLSGIDVVGEVANGREALEFVATHRPDVVLMDLTMPELNGLDATARIRREFSEVRILILSMHGDDEYVTQSLRAGANGYLLKNAGRAELEIALRAVARGDHYLSPAVSRTVVAEFVHGGGERRTPLERLTPRQREVLQLIAEGNSTKEIAAKLNLSIKTVESHRAQLMHRLGIHDVPGLVRYAIRAGVVSLDA